MSVGASMGVRECAADGCKVRVSPGILMCLPHWRSVPRKVQAKVWGTWKAFLAEPSNSTRNEYEEAVKAARESLRPPVQGDRG